MNLDDSGMLLPTLGHHPSIDFPCIVSRMFVRSWLSCKQVDARFAGSENVH